MRARRAGTRTAAWVVAAVCAAAWTTIQPVRTALAAPTFVVNSTADLADSNPGNGQCKTSTNVCTLRAAVQEVSSGASGSVGATVTLPAGTYQLATASGALLVLKSITITGAAAGTTSIVGSGSNVFDIRGTAASVSISGVTITGGAGAVGGGMFVDQGVTLAVTDSVITGNNAAGASSQGGAMYIYGASKAANVTLTRVTVSNNRAVQGGGIVNAYPANLTIVNSTIMNNVATGPYAGGIRSNGTLTMTNTTVIGNYAGFNNTSGAPGGGGIYTGNPPSPSTGQISTFTMNGGAITNNSVPLNLLSSGGGLLNATAGVATLNGVVVSGNSAFTGGGILSDEGTLNLITSEVRGNSAFFGGGLYNNDFLPANAIGAVMTIERSTVSGNRANDAGCPTQLMPAGTLCGAGGGIFNENGDLLVTNSTIAENYAGTFGGGAYNLQISGGTARGRLFNATVSANVAGRDGGGLLANLGPFTSKNSIVADNTTASGALNDCFLTPGTPAYSSGNNITTDRRCGFTAGTDKFGSPQLAPLQVYTSGTPSMMPVTGSPVIDTGDNTACAAAPVDGVDQRGVQRPIGATCDMGATEGAAPRPTPTNAARPATVRSAIFSFRNTLTSGSANTIVGFGLATDMPLLCDFDGDGTRSITVVRKTGTYLTWYGRSRNSVGGADFAFAFGAATDTPICGDWDGNGTDTPGIMRNVGGARQWIQSNGLNGSGPLTVFYFGAAADQPMYGDWDGNGTDTPGIVRPAGYALLWSYRNSNSSGITNGEFYFGIYSDRPVLGDWDNNGTDTPGIARAEGTGLRWWYRNTIVNGVASGSFLFGGANDRPLVWKGAGLGGY